MNLKYNRIYVCIVCYHRIYIHIAGHTTCSTIHEDILVQAPGTCISRVSLEPGHGNPGISPAIVGLRTANRDPAWDQTPSSSLYLFFASNPSELQVLRSFLFLLVFLHLIAVLRCSIPVLSFFPSLVFLLRRRSFVFSCAGVLSTNEWWVTTTMLR